MQAVQEKKSYYPQPQGLYNSQNEHDACGVGLVADINNISKHDIVEKGIEILNRLMHRGAVGGDSQTGDGAGILVQIPDEFFRSAANMLSECCFCQPTKAWRKSAGKFSRPSPPRKI